MKRIFCLFILLTQFTIQPHGNCVETVAFKVLPDHRVLNTAFRVSRVEARNVDRRLRYDLFDAAKISRINETTPWCVQDRDFARTTKVSGGYDVTCFALFVSTRTAAFDMKSAVEDK